jgi:hypothetical protein
MRSFVANTDYEWYRFLSGRPDLDEVNFWRPGGEQEFKRLGRGQPVLFRLKSPYNAIAGVGFFVHFSILPVSLAWAAFSVKNGAESETAMRQRVERSRRRFGKPTGPGEPDSDPRGEPIVSNRVALCKLHHAAFDRYNLGIRPDLVVDPQLDVLREADGPMLQHGLQGFQGVRIAIPHDERLQPNRDWLSERYEVFARAS